MIKILPAILMLFIWQTALATDVAPSNAPSLSAKSANPSATSASAKKDYLETLFDKVEVAKVTPPEAPTDKLYDKLARDSVAYGILKEFPNIKVGALEFRPLSRNATHKQQIRDGQDMIRKEFSSDKPLLYKDVTSTIDQKMSDPNITDMDWVLMSNAFRTLQAPGDSHKAHLLGDFIAEYILLAEIKKQESKPTLTADDRSFLSVLNYDLSQLYQAMYKNDENLFDISTQGQLYVPIDAAYQPEGSPADLGYDIPYDTLVGSHLDLLGNSLMYDPFDDLGWAELVGFGVDMMDPWFYDQFSDGFWGDYFPYGFTPYDAYGLQGRWGDIRGGMGRNFGGMNRSQMDRGVRNLSRNANHQSALNTTIRSARSQSAVTPHAGRHVGAAPGSLASTAATTSRATTSRATTTRATTTRATTTRASTPRASTPRASTSRALTSRAASSRSKQFPNIFRAVQQHAAGGGGIHAAFAGGGGHVGGGGGHAAFGGGGGGHGGGGHAAAGGHGGGGGAAKKK